jgi:RNase adapter protein RapZ
MGLQNLVIVSGMSGAGKGTVLNAFEDLGFYCIDNLPVPLLPKFLEAFNVSGGEIQRAALGIDVRSGEKLSDLERILAELRGLEFSLFVLYLEAREEVIVRRFSETRRPHPLSAGVPLQEAIRQERLRLGGLKELADVTVDTSEFSSHQLKAFVTDRFKTHSHRAGLNLQLVSFGYKYGIPAEADLLFDVRFLPNPHFVEHLRPLTGKDRKVAKYIKSFPETGEFIKRLTEFLRYLIPNYTREGKSYLTIGIGCTGGQHRSVFIAEELFRLLKLRGATMRVRHRDEGRRSKPGP